MNENNGNHGKPYRGGKMARQAADGARDDARKAARALRRRCCVCGRTFGQHGAVKPHTIAGSCDGFEAQR